MMPQRYNNKYQKSIQLFCASLLYLFAFWGTFSQYMLLWSDAFFSRNSFVSALALNPILYFYDTTTFQEADFDIERVRKSYPLVSRYLSVDYPDINNLQARSDPHNMYCSMPVRYHKQKNDSVRIPP